MEKSAKQQNKQQQQQKREIRCLLAITFLHTGIKQHIGVSHLSLRMLIVLCNTNELWSCSRKKKINAMIFKRSRFPREAMFAAKSHNSGVGLLIPSN